MPRMTHTLVSCRATAPAGAPGQRRPTHHHLLRMEFVLVETRQPAGFLVHARLQVPVKLCGCAPLVRQRGRMSSLSMNNYMNHGRDRETPRWLLLFIYPEPDDATEATPRRICATLASGHPEHGNVLQAQPPLTSGHTFDKCSFDHKAAVGRALVTP